MSMTTVFPNNPAFIGERSINNATIAGQKRPFLVTESYSEVDTYLPAKRSSHCTYWSPTDNSITVSSPKTPESGIDMNAELGSSPPCYSVTRTTGASFYDGIPQTDLATTITACGTSDLQPDQYKEGFFLYITDEPEENYRARYDSEGCRGPMKGRNGGCPTVELRSTKLHWIAAEIRVELVAADKSPLNSCKLDSTDEGSNLLKNAHPNDPRISFENLRIRRLKKGDTNSRGGNNSTSMKHQQPKQTLKGTRSKQDEKVAYLLFTARIQLVNNKFEYNGEKIIELKALSQAIHLNASHDPPEIHTIVPPYGGEGDSVAIIGTRMHSPRVSFLYNVDGKDQEVMADINKEVSHQNALVIKVPSLPVNSFNSNIASVHICVTAGKGDRTGKEPLKSNPVGFYCVYKGVCKECVMTTARQSHPFYGHQTQQPLPRQQTTPTRSPRIDSKQLLVNPSRQIIHSAKSPRPTLPTPAPPTTSQQTPGYTSPPPPHITIPVSATNSFSTNFTSGPISQQQQVISPSVCQSSPQSAATINHTSSSDMVDDILSTLCPTGGNTIEHCPVTPPQTSPAQQQCYSVVHSDSMMDGIGFGGSHSGPVSPDEFNRYLPNNSQALSNAFVPVSSTCPINSQPQQQEFTGVVFTGGNIVQPCSMGHFPQNL